jgi:tetratricopeptide (TPR) repeat protein
MRASRVVPAVVLLALVAAASRPLPALAAPAAPTRQQIAEAAARAQELLDAGQPDKANAVLEPLLRGPSPDAQLVLLHSSALILAGDNEGGRKEIEHALKLDPKLRQAWLHRAALDLLDKSYDAAYADFSEAQKLDPAAPDNAANLGAVLLLQGKLQLASEQFQRYLQANPGSADAAYLVATNYAMSGYNALALQSLSDAIALDERSRLRARVDGNFAALGKTPQFQQILNTDSYQAPAGAYHLRQTYAVPYETEKGKLLNAVLDALRRTNSRFDTNVEVTNDWALIFGEIRIKVARGADGGVVEMTAPADRMTPQQWQERTQKLLREILIHLVV